MTTLGVRESTPGTDARVTTPAGRHRAVAPGGGWLLPLLGILIGGGILGAIINAFIGAVIVLFIVGLVKKA